MMVNSQVFNTAFDTLETRNSRFHSGGCHTSGCVTNVNYSHKRNVLYPSNSMSKFPQYSISVIRRAFYVNGSSVVSSFSCVNFVLKVVSNFIKISVGNHSFTSSMMLIFWWTLKSRGDCKIRKFRYLRTYPSWNFILKASSKNLLSSGNDVSLLVVLITSSVETLRCNTVISEITWCRCHDQLCFYCI